MSEAAVAFGRAIQDAERLLARFNNDDTATKQGDGETLKRAGLVMAMAAWETYVKDRAEEEMNVYLQALEGSRIAKYVRKKLNEELKRYFNPNGERTKRLFLEFFDIDVTQSWKWGSYEPATARKTLDELVAKRGDAAHRANTAENPSNSSHTVSKADLEKAIRFLRALVNASETVRIAK